MCGLAFRWDASQERWEKYLIKVKSRRWSRPKLGFLRLNEARCGKWNYIIYFGSVSDQSLFVFFFQLHSSRMSLFSSSVVWPSWANTKWVRQMWMHEFQCNNSVRRLAGFMFTKRRGKKCFTRMSSNVIIYVFCFKIYSRSLYNWPHVTCHFATPSHRDINYIFFSLFLLFDLWLEFCHQNSHQMLHMIEWKYTMFEIF